MSNVADGRPILSVVIANYNYGHFLEDAIRSILGQGMGNLVEIIVCDAASTDNSVDIIRKYADKIAWWCSEKDHGQSEAFNKGFSHARGDWLTWLNADEVYMPDTLRRFAELVRRKPSAQWITGNELSFDGETHRVSYVKWGPHVQFPWLRRKHAPSASFGPSSFWRKDVYEKLGPIDEDLHYAMDVDYWARLTMAGIPQTRLNHHCWAFRVHNGSKTAGAQSPEVKRARHLEWEKWHRQNDYYYEYSWKNPWYCIWMIGRLLDGSLLMRFYKQCRLVGRKLPL